MNLLGDKKTIDFINTGEWSKKSIKEGRSTRRSTSPLHRRTRISPTSAARPLEAVRQCGLRSRLHQRNHRWSRVPLDSGRGRDAAGRRYVVAPPVASGRRLEVRRDLRRRTEERRAGGADDRHRAKGSARIVRWRSRRRPSTGRNRPRRLDAEHAADVRDLHRRAGIQVAAGAGRTGRISSRRTSRRRSCCTTRSMPAASTRTRSARRTARE